MDIPFAEILRCVSVDRDPSIAFNDLVSVGRSVYNSPIWDSVPEIDISADISAAQQWLKQEAADSSITGIYLGLDTLNHDDELQLLLDYIFLPGVQRRDLGSCDPNGAATESLPACVGFP